jgi:hypothetical protein
LEAGMTYEPPTIIERRNWSEAEVTADTPELVAQGH